MKKISKIMEKLKEHYKLKRKTTLNSMRGQEPWKILVSCLISLRTKDENTEKVTKKLFSIAKKLKDVAKMPLSKLEKIIYSSGYYRKKAKTIKHVASVLIKRYKGKVPTNKTKLLEIKGIGNKTANVVLNFGFNKQVLPIDTHCHRIPNRWGVLKTKNPEETERELYKILPKKYWREFNALLVLLGREICKPILPLCHICPIEKYCKKFGVGTYLEKDLKYY